VTDTSRGSLRKINDDLCYYRHQVEGIRKMCRLGSFLLADDMGLGKSLQALTVAAVDFERGFARRVLIVCPASLKWNWYEEACGPDPILGDAPKTYFKMMVLEGDPATRKSMLFDFGNLGYEVLVMNYEQVRVHVEDIQRLKFDIIIWDEAHYLKNPKSKRTKASLELLNIPRRFLLTGSPMLNRPDELWALLHAISPKEYPRYWSFVNRYCVMGGWKNKQIVGVKNKPELMGRLSNVMIRRLKSEVLDLPPKRHIPIKLPLHPQQQALYDEAVDELRMTLPDGQMEINNPLTKFLRLKEICGSTWKFTNEDHSTKLDRATEMIEELSYNEPVVVFTQFRPIIECMVRRAAAVGVESLQIHGDVPQNQRVEVIKRWSNHEKNGRRPIIVVGLQAGGIGLNMTAASTCFFIDKLFVPKLNEQAEDRLHRIGAQVHESITIYNFICRGTIESRIESILRTKVRLFDSIVDSADWQRTLAKAIMEEDGDD
jgi:SNF2 family DNA or RNA helicase